VLYNGDIAEQAVVLPNLAIDHDPQLRIAALAAPCVQALFITLQASLSTNAQLVTFGAADVGLSGWTDLPASIV
jgi:hypothetical protein